MRGNLENSGRLVRFILRRERVMSAVWIILLVLFSVALAPAMESMFDAEARQTFAVSINNPIMTSMMGPGYGVEEGAYTAGAMFSHMMLLWTIIAVAIMNIFLVVRHTRADEERGRTEVVRSLPTGRLANLNATMITAVIVNGILALLTGLGLAAMGVESMGLGGSLLYGFALGVSGLFFAAVAALFSQLSASSRGAMAYSFLTLGVFYMIRAAGDAGGNELLACLSPMGLIQRSQVYVNDYMWPSLLILLQTVVLAAIVYALNAIRDMGQGFIPARPGRKEASKLLRSPFGLAFRLLRNTLITWFIVMLTLGASYGSVIGDIYSFVGDSPEYMAILGVPIEVLEQLPEEQKAKMLIENFGAFVNTMMALISMVPLLTAAMKPRNEEKEGRAEQVLARVVPRGTYLAGYTILAFAASALMQFATAYGLYASAEAMTEVNPFTLGGLMQANMAYLPALWVMIGVAILITGLLPKATGAVWGYYGFVCFASFMGNMPGLLPEWMLHLSPMKYIAQLPLETMNYVPLAILTVIAAGLTAVGFVGYRHRDVLQY
ncbi:MAG: ABC transporter permease [Clostridia bacterium]|nr:ABC transporter permease [Clostridia bacterium]